MPNEKHGLKESLSISAPLLMITWRNSPETSKAEQRVEWEANGKMCHAAMVSERVCSPDFCKTDC